MTANDRIVFTDRSEVETIVFDADAHPTPYIEATPWPFKVSALIFSDGSIQYTAGGGGGGVSILPGPGISVTPGLGTVTITNTSPGLWQQGSGGAIFYSTGNVGINQPAPAYRFDANGTVNVTGPLFIDGELFATKV